MQPRGGVELERLHRDHRPALTRFFLRRVQNYAEAEDLTQEVFIRLAEIEAGQMRQADAYVFQTAANLLRDRARRQQVRRDYAAGALLVEGSGVDTFDPSGWSAP